jgi:serine/threonine protein kinase
MTGIRGTPGYAAPEMWMATSVTEKCNVYSFGMSLIEIAGRRKNFAAVSSSNSANREQWFPWIVWEKYNSSQLIDLVSGLYGMVTIAPIDLLNTSNTQ